MTTTNEKKIAKNVIKDRYPHLVAVSDDIIDLVRVVFSEISSEVKSNNKVLVKNFGTFSLKERTPRRRYDTGLKEVVITAPIDIVDFTQSPNIFNNGTKE